MRNFLYCLTVISASCLPTFGFAEQFLCIAEKASGFIHDGKQWKESIFNSDKKYLVDFKKGTVSLFGESEPIHRACEKYRHHGKQMFDCVTNFGEFRMSSDTMKYMITLPFVDYVIDKTAGTPHIEIGTCTKFWEIPMTTNFNRSEP